MSRFLLANTLSKGKIPVPLLSVHPIPCANGFQLAFVGQVASGLLTLEYVARFLASKFSNSGVVEGFARERRHMGTFPRSVFQNSFFVPLVSIAKGVFSEMCRRSTMLPHKALLYSEPRFCVDDDGFSN